MEVHECIIFVGKSFSEKKTQSSFYWEKLLVGHCKVKKIYLLSTDTQVVAIIPHNMENPDCGFQKMFHNYPTNFRTMGKCLKSFTQK
jgi:hypothetical protein